VVGLLVDLGEVGVELWSHGELFALVSDAFVSCEKSCRVSSCAIDNGAVAASEVSRCPRTECIW
jgi:hypothetical protein